MNLLLAGVDLGTLTCRFLIAEVSSTQALRVIESDRQILRLGEGVDQRRRLSTAAMTRVVKTLKEWRVRMQAYSLAGIVVVATSAVREANNREEFLQMVKGATGLEVEVLTGAEEAQRTLLGIQFGLPADVGSFLGLDIGGGSTEFMRADTTRSQEQPRVFSLDLGVIRLTERAFQTDPPCKEAVLEGEQLIQGELERIRTFLGDLTDVTCVGTAGTITTLAAMAQKLRQYDSSRVQNYRLSLVKIQELERDLLSCTQFERGHMPGLERGREGVIVAGTVILRVIMQTLGFKDCLVSDYGLREGILVHLAKDLNEAKFNV